MSHRHSNFTGSVLPLAATLLFAVVIMLVGAVGLIVTAPLVAAGSVVLGLLYFSYRQASLRVRRHQLHRRYGPYLPAGFGPGEKVVPIGSGNPRTHTLDVVKEEEEVDVTWIAGGTIQRLEEALAREEHQQGRHGSGGWTRKCPLCPPDYRQVPF